ncbi:MAG: 4Fe-4S dicluster domain-containing protein [Promethearchaeota archaeon]|nr:MAG: 4Fe-4S dicluster domain-containing protein [Candidatus Lokiarchaeota archaeon]
MRIIEDRCIGCGRCVYICPVQAISLINGKASIDLDLCVECSTCLRSAECPTNAIKFKHLKWPRLVRNPFSDVIATHKLTGIPGRGTEEMKTNDVTDRFQVGEVGFSIEVGRPGIGTRLANIELFTTRLSQIQVDWEPNSPITALFEDDQGHINDEIKKERVLSVIIEFKIPLEKVPTVLEIIRHVETEIDTVFSVGVVSRVMAGGNIPIIDLLESEGFTIRPNAKVNLGLGRLPGR